MTAPSRPGGTPWRGWFGRPARAGGGTRGGGSRSVFFSAAWFYLAGALALLGMATGHGGMTLLGVLVLLTGGASWGWNRICLDGVTHARDLSADRALPGDEITLTLTVTNRKLLPMPWLTLEEELSDGLVVHDRPVSPGGTAGRQVLRISAGFKPYERVTWRVRLSCPRRGLHAVGPATVRSGDIFGFFTNRVAMPAADRVLVYPRVVDLGSLTLPSREPIGELRARCNLLVDPSRVVGVREYRPEDPFRSIHWKATARQGALQVRVAEPMTALRLGIFLNLDTFDHYWEGLDLELAERSIVAAASLAVWADTGGYAVGLYANGLVAGSDQPLRVPPGRGPGQVPRLLEGLAMISPFSTLPFPAILAGEGRRLAYGGTIAIITSRFSDTLAGVVLQLLDANRRVVVFPLGGCEPPPMRGMIVRRLDEAGLEPNPSDARVDADEEKDAPLPGTDLVGAHGMRPVTGQSVS